MINQTEINLVKQNLFDAFATDARPDLSSVHPLGCCEEHESRFEWYRHHSWQEFAEELPRRQLDSCEFSSLNPLAYHYFTPGILIAMLNSIETEPNKLVFIEDWKKFLLIEEWMPALYPLKGRIERFKRDYLPLFTSRQKDVVADSLKVFNDWHSEMKGYPDSDVERAINQIWRSEI